MTTNDNDGPFMQRVYDSEIGAAIEWFWDGGFDVTLGDTTEIEHILLDGFVTAVNATGSNTKNSITGNAENNTLNGRGGDDKLWCKHEPFWSRPLRRGLIESWPFTHL